MRQKCIKALGGKPQGKRQLGSPRPRWDDNIKMDLKEILRICGLDQDREQ
jgi:hypothetical protein